MDTGSLPAADVDGLRRQVVGHVRRRAAEPYDVLWRLGQWSAIRADAEADSLAPAAAGAGSSWRGSAVSCGVACVNWDGG